MINNVSQLTVCEKNVYRMAFDHLPVKKQAFIKEVLDLLHAKGKEGIFLSKSDLQLISAFYFSK